MASSWNTQSWQAVIRGIAASRKATWDDPVPRYFFNVHDGQHPSEQDPPDTDGTVLSDPEAARSQAVTLAGELLKDLDGRFWGGSDWWLRVTDEQGGTVCTLRFSGTHGDIQGHPHIG